VGRGLAVLLLALLAVGVGAASPAAAQGISVGADGTTEPVFDLEEAVRERVFIPQPGIDQDDDGDDDRIALEIIRPKESGPALKVPALIDPSPYYTTVCRGNEGECIDDVDSDGLNDRWPLFYDNYFVPRGYAYLLAESNGTANSTGCPLHGGPGDIAGMKSVIDWLNGRVTAVTAENAAGDPVTADWHNGSSAMIGKSYDGTLANGVAATGVDGLKTIIPITAISSWYLYSRQGGIRLNTNYPSNLSGFVTNSDRRALCAPSRAVMGAADGDDTGDFNPFWDEREYLADVDQVKAAVFVAHGLQDDNVTTDHFALWWEGLAANDVPRKLWLMRTGHVDPFDSRRAEWVDTLHRWLDHWLHGIDNGIMDEPRVDIEESADDWHTYPDWPVPGTQETDVYLWGTTPTDAGTVGLGSGGDLASASFVDSPNQSENTAISSPTGSQTARRVFLSAPLTADLRISGTPRVDIVGSLNTTQSNLGAYLVDYGAGTQITRSNDGVANQPPPETCWGQSTPQDDACYLEVRKVSQSVTVWRVARGILDSSNRDSLRIATPVTIGAPTRFAWPLYPHDHVFKTGHQIGIVIVGNAQGVNGTNGATITLDTKLSKVRLPIVGGYTAARASGAFAPDLVAPVQTLPADIAVEPDGSGSAKVDYPAPGVTDNEDPAPTVDCNPPSGSTFPLGVTTVACTARDASGNESTGTFTVRVGKAGATTPPQTGPLPAPPPPAATGPAPPPPAPRIGAPSRNVDDQQCLSRRRFDLRIIRRRGLRVKLRGARITRAVVTGPNGVRKRLRHKRRVATVDLRGMRAGRAKVELRIRLGDGVHYRGRKSVTFTRTYTTCRSVKIPG